MDSKIVIRQIGAAHADFIEQIVAMTHRFSHESHIYEKLGFNPDKFRAYVKFHTESPAAVFIAEHNGVVTGYAIFFIDQQYITEKNFEIVTIYVPPEYRKTETGRMLASALVQTMDLNGCKYGQISICCAMKENEDLINALTANMFKKFGFYQIGTIMGRKGKIWD